MKHLTATTTPTDEARATRIVLAWLAGDRLGFDLVLTECDADPDGVLSLVCVLTDFLARLGTQAAPDFADQLRASLLPPEDE